MREIHCEQRLQMGGGGDDKPGAKVYDPIALNSIWREHIKKERGVLKLNEKFRLNPHALAVSLHLPCRAWLHTPGRLAPRLKPSTIPTRAGRTA